MEGCPRPSYEKLNRANRRTMIAILLSMVKRDDKRLIRTIKRAVKRDGNKHRRRALKADLREHPEDAHLAEEDLGGQTSEHFNGIHRPVDGKRE